MSAPTFLGYATVHGIDGTIAYTGMATTDNLFESLTAEEQVQEHEAKDKTGETVGLKLWNRRRNLTIKFYPAKTAAGGAIAAAKLLVDLPVVGAVVTIASDAEAASPNFGINSAKWIYAGGGSINKTNSDDVYMTLPLRRYATDISTQST